MFCCPSQCPSAVLRVPEHFRCLSRCEDTWAWGTRGGWAGDKSLCRGSRRWWRDTGSSIPQQRPVSSPLRRVHPKAANPALGSTSTHPAPDGPGMCVLWGQPWFKEGLASLTHECSGNLIWVLSPRRQSRSLLCE